MSERVSRREQRVSAARRMVRRAVDRDRIRAALKAAGANEPDDAAVEAAAVLAEERLAEIAARCAECSEDREEKRLSAASVAVAAAREAEERRAIRAER
ncbi:MAG: hypothetical protein ABSD68_00775 [Candidatus Micrarchaeales archaeon]|jgi:hypothetical protein